MVDRVSDKPTSASAAGSPAPTSRPRGRLRRSGRAETYRTQSQRRRRKLRGRFGVGLLVVIAVLAVVLGPRLGKPSEPSDDYRGTGKHDLVITVTEGDSTTAIAQNLQKRDVIKSVRVFVEAAHGNAAIAAIQPGFYVLRTEIPAADAIARLADPQHRVGKLVVPEGRQLDDTTDLKSGVVTPGIFTLISRASCVELDGNRHCLSADDLRTAAGTVSLADLSVPDWAIGPVTALGTDHRRIEGLVAPGTVNVDPAGSATSVLAGLIAASAKTYAQSGLFDTAPAGLAPYEILVVASLVQQEAKVPDFSKVARVIDNRLRAHRKLEFDSTVNYSLARRAVATSDHDRNRVTPWNTYASAGLPATPICSPGAEAVRAAASPEPGNWLYFVTVDAQGTTLFTDDYQQHLVNIELAKRNGFLEGAPR